jgi:hypothetical protein
MSGVPYTFATATTSIPLSQLDANFATPATLGNTTVGLGNTVTTIGNLTLTNATISSLASQLGVATMPTGSVIQTVQVTDSTARSTTSGTGVYSGFSASITPQFSTSKILVILNVNLAVSGGTNANVIMGGAIYRGSSTQLNGFRNSVNPLVSGDFDMAISSTYLDSPATTSSVNYQFWWSRYNSSYDATINMGGATGQFGAGWSSFTLLEIR